MDKLNIPSTIKVGFQSRPDTYTGKLAYIIYIDEKGKVRKETSWDGWRDKSIQSIDYENVPTSGFVLNKGVGGARESWGWNARNEYIRVYDPRNFEFEISVANLLFILQECTSIKGKGLEGEFVYSWDGTELVLLPVDTTEYKSSTEFTANKSKKVSKSDVVEGCHYIDKNMCTLMYVGRELCREDISFGYNRDEIRNAIESQMVLPSSKKHIFWNFEQNVFEFHRGFTQLAERITTEPDPTFVDVHANYINSNYHARIVSGELYSVGSSADLEDRDNCKLYIRSSPYHRHYESDMNKMFVLYNGHIHAATYYSDLYRYVHGSSNIDSEGYFDILGRVSRSAESGDVLAWHDQIQEAFKATRLDKVVRSQNLEMYSLHLIYNNNFTQGDRNYVQPY